jgi:high-affinity iron transporter
LLSLAFPDMAARRRLDQYRARSGAVKAVRPLLADTLSALQQGDVGRAKEAFEGYDSAWNGIEVYINVRSRDLYRVLELELQARIAKALDAPRPEIASLVVDVQAMIAKYDEAIETVTMATPLNSLYDELARLRIVRAHLREVNPALKAGNIAKAQKAFETFNDKWFNVEDLSGRSLLTRTSQSSAACWRWKTRC